MGKITDMQGKQNDFNIAEARRRVKPKLEINGFKDIATLIGPSSSKRYRLSPDQKRFKFGARLTIGALVAAGALVTYSLVNSAPEENNIKAESTMLTQNLDRESVIANAENELFNIIYQENPDFNKKLLKQGLIKTEYPKDDIEAVESIRVSKKISLTSKEENVDFQYNKHNSIFNSGNSKLIEDFVELLISVHNNENISQKKIQELDELIEQIRNTSFTIEDGKIIEGEEKYLTENDLDER